MLLSQRYGDHRLLHSFPTRRSSDLILAHILGEARARGYTRLSLETGSMAEFKPAHKLYESVGFTYCGPFGPDRKSTRLNSSHLVISYAVFCLKKKKNETTTCTHY